jgi:hypothetical protein
VAAAVAAAVASAALVVKSSRRAGTGVRACARMRAGARAGALEDLRKPVPNKRRISCTGANALKPGPVEYATIAPIQPSSNNPTTKDASMMNARMMSQEATNGKQEEQNHISQVK